MKYIGLNLAFGGLHYELSSNLDLGHLRYSRLSFFQKTLLFDFGSCRISDKRSPILPDKTNIISFLNNVFIVDPDVWFQVT